MNLSEHFLLEEFTRSQVAARMGLAIVPSAQELANLKRLCETVLEPIRTRIGRPIVISSGLRPLWLNEIIGGAKISAHIDGRAADINVVGMAPVEFARWVRNQDFAELDQCISEFGDWVHVAIAPGLDAPRRQYLTASHKAGQTLYTEGV